jgi:hypothetical protein
MRSVFWSRAAFVVGVLGLAGSVVAGLQASVVGAPEIDGASIATGLALASAGMLMLRSRWRSK